MDNFSQSTEQEHLEEDILNEYLDDYLTPEGRASVDKHLSTCPTCAVRFQQLQRLFSDLEEMPDLSLEHDLSRQVLKAITNKPQIPSFIKWSMLPQLAIAVLVLLTLLPKYLQDWLVLLPKAIDLSVDYHLVNRLARSMDWLSSVQFLPSSWQFPSPDLSIQFPALNNINWLLFTVVFVLLLIVNGYLLRQVVRNGTH